MITYQKYYQKEVRENNKYHTKSCLVAKLRFKDEVAPVDRNLIKERIENLNGYLKIYEGIRYSDMNRKYLDEVQDGSDQNKKRCLSIKGYSRKLGIDIKISSNWHHSSEELLNLFNLNHFILTGK